MAAFLNKKFTFKDKHVFITGGSRGLGLSLAWNLLDQGAHVTLVARKQDELDRGRAQLLKDFPKANVHVQVCDVTDGEALGLALEGAEARGGIDLLINNAGSILVGPFSAMRMEDFEAQMKLHLYAVIEATRRIIPHFRSRGGGRILNICSLGGKIAVPHMLPYDVSKFALAGFSQGVGPELLEEGIRLTTAYPTVMRTGSPIQAVFKGDHEAEYEWFSALDHLPGLSMSADVAAKKILAAVRVGRTEIVLSAPAKARMLMGVLFPETTNSLMALAAKALPKGISQLRKTGADSASLFDRNPLLKPLQKAARKARSTYNQKPKHDAEYNMGLQPR